MFKKLTEQHLEEILKQAAIGKKPIDLRGLLEAGIETSEGSTLVPIESIDESTIRKHIARRPDAILEYRQVIYGDLSREPLAYPAYRLRERGKLYEQCVAGADAARTGRGKRSYLTIAAKILTDAGNEVSALAPREGPQHKHVHLHSEGTSELTATLASRLAELGRAGMLDTAAEVLGSKRKRERERKIKP